MITTNLFLYVTRFFVEIVRRRVRRGGVHWVHVHPPPNLGKKFRSEMSKRGEKFQPRYVGKKECRLSELYSRFFSRLFTIIVVLNINK